MTDNDVLFAGIGDHPHTVEVIKSTDDGETWLDCSQGIEQCWVQCFAFYNDTVYAGTFACGMFYSTDYGETWNQNLANVTIWSIAVNQTGVLYSNFNNGIYKSKDGGLNWIEILPGYSQCKTILPDVEGYIFVAGATVMRSSDDGVTWSEVNNGINYIFNETLFYGTDNSLYLSGYGIFKSTDLGDKWAHVGFNNTNILDIEIDALDNIYAGTYNRVFLSTNKGDNWEFKGFGIWNNTPVSVIHTANNGDIWAGASANNSGLYLSTDKGENWTKIESTQFDLIYSIDDNSLGDMFITSGALFYSNDNGNSWQIKHNEPYGRVFITNSDVIYFGHRHSLEVSFDNGEYWTDILQTNYINKIYVDKKHNIFVASDDGLLRSSNNGITWDTVSTQFVTPYVRAITGNSTNQLYCTVRTKVAPLQFAYYASYDDGMNWVDITEDMPSEGTSLAIDSEGYLYAGTSGNSVFKSGSTTVDVEGEITIPSSYILYQNYPNPFNPVTTIKYQIPKLSFVTLKVYDVLGNEIVALVNEEKPAGSYEVEFNGANLTSGVYFYRIQAVPSGRQAGSFVETKKMILLR